MFVALGSGRTAVYINIFYPLWHIATRSNELMKVVDFAKVSINCCKCHVRCVMHVHLYIIPTSHRYSRMYTQPV